jgi:hypothetical protein
MRSLITALLVGGWAASLGAQATATIDPGMSRDQVVAKLGEPLSTRAYDSHTYLMYKNGCEKTCGMNDLVILDSGKVVDAVFRSSGRHYSGTSSSPRMISMNEAQHGNATGPLAVPAGEPKTKPAPKKAAESVPMKKDVVPAKTAMPAPKKDAGPAPKKDEAAASKAASPPPAPKKTEAAPAAKPATAPAKKPDPKKPEPATKPPTTEG